MRSVVSASMIAHKWAQKHREKHEKLAVGAPPQGGLVGVVAAIKEKAAAAAEAGIAKITAVPAEHEAREAGRSAQPEELYEDEDVLLPTYASRSLTAAIPKYRLQNRELPARVAAQLLKDEVVLDTTPQLNLASFVTTWMEPEVEDIMQTAARKNLIDIGEYAATADVQQRCIAILSNLWNHQGASEPVGTSCVGSSEAIMLGVLAAKFYWRNARKAKGLPHDKPKLVMPSSVQIVWHKACRYLDIEEVIIPHTRGCYTLNVDAAVAAVDENTIAVACIVGNTYTGSYDDVATLNERLAEVNERNGWDVGIHVDAASGGFVAPFVTAQKDIVWDFRLPLVRSINASGHKYGLCYPGIGWVVFADQKYCPEELGFSVSYLGGKQNHMSLNFSRSASGVAGQYYMFLRLGMDGYRRVIEGCFMVRQYLVKQLLETGWFELLGDPTQSTGVPCLTLSLRQKVLGLPAEAAGGAGSSLGQPLNPKPSTGSPAAAGAGAAAGTVHRNDKPKFTVYDLCQRLKERLWVIPAYPMAESMEDVDVMRIVVREGFSYPLAEKLVQDIKSTIAMLQKQEAGADDDVVAEIQEADGPRV